MITTYLMVIAWLAPLLLALSLMWSPLRSRAVRLLPWVMWPSLVLLVTLWLQPEVMTVFWPNILLGLVLKIDAMTPYWLGLTLVVWWVAAWHSRWVVDEKSWQYALFFLLSFVGSLGLVLAGDAVSFYLSFSLMSLAAWGLVIHERSDEAKRAARWYIQLAIVGELLLFVGIVSRAAGLETTDLSVWISAPSADWVLLILWLGLAIKVGVPLLHMWLPLAHPAAPIPASAVLSGVMIKAGVLGWLVLLPQLEMQYYAQPMQVLGLVTMAFGAVLGLLQTQAKTILAYSSISQMGWLIFGVGLLWQGDHNDFMLWWIFGFALHHALIKAALFLGVGWIKTTRVDSYAGWAVWAGMILLALLLAGLPYGSAAWLKQLVKTEMALSEGWQNALLFASVATALLMIHFIRSLTRLQIHAKPRIASAWWHWWGLIGLALIWPMAWSPLMLPDWATWVNQRGFAGAESILIAVMLALAWRIRIQRQWTLPAGDIALLWERLGRIIQKALLNYQAWWGHQQQHVKWWQLKSRQWERKTMHHLDGIEKKLLYWPTGVTLTVGLLVLMFWLVER